MSRNILREGFAEVARDPALLLIEIGWRWTFGAAVIVVLFASLAFLLGSTTVSTKSLDALAGMAALDVATTIANATIALGLRLFGTLLIDASVLAICWIVLSALGRHATLLRPALAPGASQSTCFAISTWRALVTTVAVAIWIGVGFSVGFAASRAPSPPNVIGIALVLLPILFLLVVAWSVANWYLSLAPLFAEERWHISVREAWKLAAGRSDEVLAVSIATGVIRLALLTAAFAASFALVRAVADPRLLFADLVAISGLYCLSADFVYVARLAAYAKHRPEALPVPENAMPIADPNCSEAEPGAAQPI
ncbi:MAG TPA: hypothetical protein VFQ00_08175 [Terriglobales bacterium]|nr:hypothetical protein [Terriglobales bacterium]